jgi:hypothetical protein
MGGSTSTCRLPQGFGRCIRSDACCRLWYWRDIQKFRESLALVCSTCGRVHIVAMSQRQTRQTRHSAALPNNAKEVEPRASLSGDELAAQEGGPLPDKEAMSTITISLGSGAANVAVPINEALAANIDSQQSAAVADASQIVVLPQNAQQS